MDKSSQFIQLTPSVFGLLEVAQKVEAFTRGFNDSKVEEELDSVYQILNCVVKLMGMKALLDGRFSISADLE